MFQLSWRDISGRWQLVQQAGGFHYDPVQYTGRARKPGQGGEEEGWTGKTKRPNCNYQTPCQTGLLAEAIIGRIMYIVYSELLYEFGRNFLDRLTERLIA